MTKLFDPIDLGAIHLKNRIAMAPLTRSRAIEGEVPNPLAVEYYAQRASTGLIISEATQISRSGQGYPNTPGIFTAEQVAGWKPITDAVHAKGGKMVAQLWHVGRVSLSDYQPDGLPGFAPSAIAIASGQGMRPDFSMTDFETPRALTVEQIEAIVGDYVHAAKNAIEAGFDGVEIHAANGYLIDQFLKDGANKREDQYGGSVENRARFMLEVTTAVVDAIGADRTGIRLSPSNGANGTLDSDPASIFLYAAAALKPFGLAYLHLIEGEEGTPMSIKNGAPQLAKQMREAFGGPVMLNGGLTRELAEKALAEGRADLVSSGVPVLSNPDLVERWKKNAPLNAPDKATFYGGGAKGYTDYPFLETAEA
ncbi:alkene reductase [Brevundimonas sp. NIBR11]|uniref:alkene reductase n=1 Tax=Brevundimonas sp. NIBR11 TaxID=3015999 RepID=UPI0022F0C10D|nr:alkene reductase [Brevundimonas sp. NIBR11]WGM30215.1 N-ethylmaleimide reductase [Brevundimonas sp. NIBR11]